MKRSWLARQVVQLECLPAAQQYTRFDHPYEETDDMALPLKPFEPSVAGSTNLAHQDMVDPCSDMLDPRFDMLDPRSDMLNPCSDMQVPCSDMQGCASARSYPAGNSGSATCASFSS